MPSWSIYIVDKLRDEYFLINERESRITDTFDRYFYALYQSIYIFYRFYCDRASWPIRVREEGEGGDVLSPISFECIRGPKAQGPARFYWTHARMRVSTKKPILFAGCAERWLWKSRFRCATGVSEVLYLYKCNRLYICIYKQVSFWGGRIFCRNRPVDFLHIYIYIYNGLM